MIRQRTLWASAEVLLLIACAEYWFGNTGLGLAILWLAGPGRPRLAAVRPTSLAGMRAVWVSERRVLLRAGDGRRHEIYRDEVSVREWASLKRLCHSGQLGQNDQLATGRNTSI